MGNRVCLGVGNEEPIEYDDDSVADPDFIPNSPESDVSHNDIIRPVVRHSPSIGTSVTRRNILSQPSSSPIAPRSCSPVTSRSPVAGCSSKSTHRRPTSVTRQNIISQHSSSPTTRDSHSPVNSRSHVARSSSKAHDDAADRSDDRPHYEQILQGQDEQEGWNYRVQGLSRQPLLYEDFIQTKNTSIPEESNLYSLFCNDNVPDLMTEQTNIYAEQFMVSNRSGRMSRWKPVDNAEMKKFLGIYMLTGIIKSIITIYYFFSFSYILSIRNYLYVF